MAGSVPMWQSMTMQLIQALLSLAVPVMFGLGTVITIVALRRAPEGSEDNEGFHYRPAFQVPRPAPARRSTVDTMPPMGGTHFA